MLSSSSSGWIKKLNKLHFAPGPSLAHVWTENKRKYLLLEKQDASNSLELSCDDLALRPNVRLHDMMPVHGNNATVSLRRRSPHLSVPLISAHLAQTPCV